jgi:Uma2 family endonuclease
MDALLDPLTRSPKLSIYLQELRDLLDREQEQRLHFRDRLNEDAKAEFINGEVIVHSPAKLEHTETQKLILKLLNTFVSLHSLGTVLHEKALVALTRNDYEPDIAYWRAGKAAAFEPGMMIFPPADFVVEILSPSTEHVDRGVKFEDYAAHGTGEYWIVDPVAHAIEQYVLDGGAFVPLATHDERATITSAVVAGFSMPVKAAFDPAANLAALREMLA